MRGAAAARAERQRRPDMVVASPGEMMIKRGPARRSWMSTILGVQA